MEKQLQGRIALVTGASRGIGRAFAQRLAAEGCDVVVHASGRSTELLAETKQLVESLGARAACLEANLVEADEREGLIAKASEFFGPIDILINNAAVTNLSGSPLTETLKKRRRMMELNVQAPMDLAQQAIPAMIENGRGDVLNIGSATVNQQVLPYKADASVVHSLAFYGASKSALNRISEGLGHEMFGTPVKINVLGPTSICITENAIEVSAGMQKSRPEMLETVEMIAEAAVILLAGNMSGMITDTRELLTMTGSAVHSLDKAKVLGDAASFVEL